MQNYPFQPIFDIAEILSRHGIENVMMSPGSRCAPLTLAFARHPKLNCLTIGDERSAAFVALGMAQASVNPGVLLCTSGTAALNYAPAVAEAFYQQIPLIVITADRPPEWIDQLDGQTIRQNNLYGGHVKKSACLPVDYSHPDAIWHIGRLLSESVNAALAYPQGPVHINAPFREPFYPDESFSNSYSKAVKVFQESLSQRLLPVSEIEQLKKELQEFPKKLLVVGQGEWSAELIGLLKELKIPVVADIISNAQSIPASTRHQDWFLHPSREGAHKNLRPDLLLTFGKSLISKNLKLYLRKHKPQAHWHIQESGDVADTFQALTKIIRTKPERFFEAFTPGLQTGRDKAFADAWAQKDEEAADYIQDSFQAKAYTEFSIIKGFMEMLPESGVLHLANSMAVRYANFLNRLPEGFQVYANRGASGIDGSTSTALGHALAVPDKTHFLITGDMAFFYDRNAFWNNYVPKNLKVLLLNNAGGGIFRMIPGPRQQPELKEFFETRQASDAYNLCKEHGLAYISVHKLKAFEAQAERFLSNERACVMEVFTDAARNQAFFADFVRG